MTKKNIVFIARSIDGFIAGKNGELDWLHAIPNPDNVDMGYHQLMAEIDALVMGRTTFETVLGFGIDWPYTRHVFVLSHTLQAVPEALRGKVTLTKGNSPEILDEIHARGFFKLYIDGGRTVQDFLRADLIDELRITTIPSCSVAVFRSSATWIIPWNLSIWVPGYSSVKSCKTTIGASDKTPFAVEPSSLNQSIMTLGAFSVSLAVKDLRASKAFYEKLGFEPFAGSMEMNYLILKNGDTLIGLFQGMFEGNILTFNPGWDSNAKPLDQFDDVRDIQKKLKDSGIKVENEVDEASSGPGSFMVVDPDGNAILIDQHI